MPVKTSRFRPLIVGTTVAAATLLGTMGAVTPAQAAIINLEVDVTSANTTPVVVNGIDYQPGTKAKEYFTFDTVAGTGTGHAVITTPTGPVTIPVLDITSGMVDTGGARADFGLQTSSVQFYSNTAAVPGFIWDSNPTPALYQQYCNNFNTLGPVTAFDVVAYVGNGPAFRVNDITFVAVPEPSSLALGVAGAVGALALRRRREPSMRGL
jgi:hypothetical protein